MTDNTSTNTSASPVAEREPRSISVLDRTNDQHTQQDTQTRLARARFEAEAAKLRAESAHEDAATARAAAESAAAAYRDLLTQVASGNLSPEDQQRRLEKIKEQHPDVAINKQKMAEPKETNAPQKTPRTIGERVAQTLYEVVRGGPVKIVYGEALEGIHISTTEAKIIIPDNNFSESNPPTIEQVVESIKVYIGKMNDSQVDRAGLLARRMREIAQDTSLDPATRQELHDSATKIQGIIQNRRQITPGHPEFISPELRSPELSVATATVNFNQQVFAEFAQFMTGKKVDMKSGDTVSVEERDGTIVITLPDKADIRILGELREKLKEQHILTTGSNKAEEFAGQLQDAAYLMASMNVSQEERALEKARQAKEQGKDVRERQYVKPVFSDKAIATLYNAGQALLHPEAVQQFDEEQVAKQVTEKAKSEEVKQKLDELKDSNDPQNLKQTRKDDVFLKIFMGKDTSYALNGKTQETFFDRAYDRLFDTWAKREAQKPPDKQLPLNREGFAQYMANGMGVYAGILSPSLDRFLETGGGGQSRIAEVAKSRLTESMAEEHLSTWVEAVQRVSTQPNEGLRQTIHEKLLAARKDGAKNPEEEIIAVTEYLQSPQVVDHLKYAPGEILNALRAGRPQAGQEALWEAACNIKAAYALEEFQKLGYDTGVRLEGNHVYLVIDTGTTVLRVDPSTPKELIEKGIAETLSGVTEITKDEEVASAKEAISAKNGKDIIIGSLYHNVAMQLDPETQKSTVVALLDQGLAFNPNAAISLYSKGKVLHDEEMLQQAIALDSHIATAWEMTNGLIGDYRQTFLYAPRDPLGAPPPPLPSGLPANPGTPPPTIDAGLAPLQAIVDDVRAKIAAAGELGGLSDRDLDKALVDIANNVYFAGLPIAGDPAELYVNELKEEKKRRQEEVNEKAKAAEEEKKFRGRGELKEEHRPAFKAIEAIAEKKRLKTLAGDKLSAIEETEAVNKLKEVLAYYNINGAGVSHDLVELAGQFDETREMLINQIMFEPYKQTELSRYQIESFYVGPYLTILMNSFTEQALRLEEAKKDPKNAGKVDALQEEANHYRDTRADYKKLQNSVEFFHNMNADIIKGDMRDLSIQASNMQKEQFEFMSKVYGFGEAMALYEDEYRRELAEYGKISPDSDTQIQKNVKRRLKEMSEKGLIRSQFSDRRESAMYRAAYSKETTAMDTWEIERAAFAGRAFFNVFMRSGSFIAIGEMPSGVDSSNSIPQEKISEVLNFMHVIIRRWETGSNKGGKEFIDDFQRNWFEKLRQVHYKLGVNQIYRAGGATIDSRELAAYTMVHDFMSVWRIATVSFPAIYGDFNSAGTGHEISVKDFLDGKMTYNGKEMTRLEYFDTLYKEKADGRLTRELRTIVDKTDLGLGALLTHPVFFNTKDPSVGYEGRKLLWKKVAETNIPVMMDFLDGLKGCERDANGMVTKVNDDEGIIDHRTGQHIQSLKQILGTRASPAGNVHAGVKYVDGGKYTDAWHELRAKFEHNRKVYEMQARAKNPKSRIAQDIAAGKYTIPARVSLAAEEQAIERLIMHNGNLLSSHLADTVWNNVPFLDVPFEDLQFGNFGSNEFQRKMGDTADESNAGNILYGMSLNAGGKGRENFMENAEKVVSGFENPEGSAAATMRFQVLHKTRLDWVMAKKGQRFGPWMGVKGIYGHLSKAQDFQGKQAEAILEPDVAAEIDLAQKMGFLTEDEARKLKKMTGSLWFNILWAYFRDTFIFVAAAEGIELAKAVAGDEMGLN